MYNMYNITTYFTVQVLGLGIVASYLVLGEGRSLVNAGKLDLL